MRKFLLILISILLLLSFCSCREKVTDVKTPYIQDGYWYIDGVNTGVKAVGVDGKDGINGADGADGADGIDGVDGQNGKTPYIQDGYWYFDGINTGVKAEGTDGKNGLSINSIAINELGQLVITLSDGTQLPPLEIPNTIVNSENVKIVQAAKVAYADYVTQNSDFLTRHMIYEHNGHFVAFENGNIMGIFENTTEAAIALVGNLNNHYILKSLSEEMYLVLDITDYRNKKIVCIGDSVTYGVGANPNPNYVTTLGNILDSDAINLGSSGTSLCENGSRVCQFSKLNEQDLQGANIVTIYLGINDWAAAGIDGTGKAFYSLGTPDSTDVSTIYGAMRMWCDKIEELKKTEQYKNTLFFFVTPHLTSWNNSVIGGNKDWYQSKRNVHGYTQAEMGEAIKTVCSEYGIPVIDMYNYTIQLYNQDPTTYINEYAGDGVHPTAACHALMADYILRCLVVQ